MPPLALARSTPGGGLKEVHGHALPVATLKMSDLPLCQSEYLCPLSLALANASDGFGLLDSGR
jgi:hypothetical protein